MRWLGPGILLFTVACATGGAASDDTSGTDSGVAKPDSSTQDSGGGPKDSGGTKDTGTPPPQDSGGTNCGGQCLGTLSTCCNNQCVDITSDPNNCGGCNTACGTASCCAGNCVDTMGTDNANCGGCGVACAGTCTNGQCQTGGGSCTLDKGTCAHSPCTTGGALSASCDSNDEGIVLLVCIYDATCCSGTWDSTCVSWATLFEANACSGGGC